MQAIFHSVGNEIIYFYPSSKILLDRWRFNLHSIKMLTYRHLSSVFLIGTITPVVFDQPAATRHRLTFVCGT